MKGTLFTQADIEAGPLSWRSWVRSGRERTERPGTGSWKEFVICDVTVWREQLGKCQSQLAPSMMPGGRAATSLGLRRKECPGHPWSGGHRSGYFQVDDRVRSPVRLPRTCLQIPGGLLALPQAGPTGTVTPRESLALWPRDISRAAPELTS